MLSYFTFLGKSLIGKERAIRTAENEALKSNPAPVFFLSMVGVNGEGFIQEDEYIFDIYTKLFDFLGCDVQVKSAQDLWDFYKSKHNGADRNSVDVYKITQFFIKQHIYGHFVIDECPFRGTRDGYIRKYNFKSILPRHE